MSRSDPYKLKPQTARRTVLLVGEGRTEEAFLKHLRRLYLEREAGIYAKVEQAGGGSPDNVIHYARKRLQSTAYDRCLILFDTDVAAKKSLPSKIGKTNMAYVKSSPCIEGLFLKILDHQGFSTSTASVDTCKRIFHSTYLSEKEKLDPARYDRIMPKEVLEERRKIVEELEAVLKVLGG